MDKKPVVIRVTKEEFELDDGRVYPHMVEFDEAPTIEDFQKTYDKVRHIFKAMLNKGENNEKD